jgi:hypothetical protein
MARCVVCLIAWDPKPAQINFHGLCNSCFSIYDRLKRSGRSADRSGRICSDNERFFAYAIFPFSETSGIKRLSREINFSVSLINIGSNKAKVILGVRDATELSISEAKSLVEKAPCEIVEGLEKWKAMEIAKKLKSLGADVKIINKPVEDVSSANEPTPENLTD